MADTRGVLIIDITVYSSNLQFSGESDGVKSLLLYCQRASTVITVSPPTYLDISIIFIKSLGR